MDVRFIAGLVAIFGGGALYAASWQPDASMELIHWDSRPTPDGEAFEEVFRIDAIHRPLAVADLSVFRDGALTNVTWSSDPVDVGSELAFVAEAFDRFVTLRIESAGAVVWQAEYGAGAGTPIG